jgi:alkanesulfonate monooxygenase SsuD/methylene tetrahydromethanopterin reductase-like flavin-dependent oxidoreductase (luciferase family)
MLAIMNRLWSEDDVSFAGRYYRYENVTISPKPKQTPLPVWIGGNSDAAIERTARYGSGWLGGGAQLPAQTARVIAAIKERSMALGRPIDSDHYGASVPFRFGSWDEPVVRRNVEALTARVGHEIEPEAYLAVGDAAAIIQLIRVLRSVGVSKFVLRPISTSDDDMIDQTCRLAEEVIPTVHAFA